MTGETIVFGNNGWLDYLLFSGIVLGAALLGYYRWAQGLQSRVSINRQKVDDFFE